MRTPLLCTLVLVGGMVAGSAQTMVETADPKTKIAEIIRSDDDPRWGPDQTQGSRLSTLIYWMVVAQRQGLKVEEVVAEAYARVDPTVGLSLSERLNSPVPRNIMSNWMEARKLGLLIPGNVQILKVGGRPTVIRGRYPGNPVVVGGPSPEVFSHLHVKNRLERLYFCEAYPERAGSLPPAPAEFITAPPPTPGTPPTGSLAIYERHFRERIPLLPYGESRWELEVREKSADGIKAVLVSYDKPVRRVYGAIPNAAPGAVKDYAEVRDMSRPAEPPVPCPSCPARVVTCCMKPPPPSCFCGTRSWPARTVSSWWSAPGHSWPGRRGELCAHRPPG